MEYPLIIAGEKRGRFTVEQAGLYTVMEAELPGCGEGMYRIWVQGGGERAYLGLMQPWSGGMYLRRKLSRREMERFPKQIEYAGDGIERQEQDESQAQPRPAASALSCPVAAEEVPDSGELLWLRRADGSLVAHDGLSSLVALPSSLRREGKGAVLRIIEGREYIVFRY